MNRRRSTSITLGLVLLAALGTLALANPGPAGASPDTTTVKAVETDFHIALSQKTFKAGKYIFVAIDKGKTTHSLKITGPGLKNAVTPDISPGQSVKLKVTLASGKYDVYCPIPGHKALGMNANINVTATVSASSSNTGTTKPSSAGTGGVSY